MTSLSLQLNQLRTASNEKSRLDAAVDEGARILGGNASLDPVVLEGVAEKGFQELLDHCPPLRDFKKKIFEDEAEAEDEFWKEDLLLLLSPFMLRESCQFVVQFLVTRHSFHLSHPEACVLSALPYYSYNLFHNLVALVPALSGIQSSSPQYPQWLTHFREQCHPCTKIGLTKHLAKDYGFFKMLCEFILKAEKHQRRYVCCYTHFIYLLRHQIYLNITQYFLSLIHI